MTFVTSAWPEKLKICMVIYDHRVIFIVLPGAIAKENFSRFSMEGAIRIMQAHQAITTMNTGSSTLFLGKYPCALDGENRLSIPAAFRGPLAGAAYITQGFERNLLVLTAEAFHEIYQRVKSLNMADPLARLLLRMILGTASESPSMDGEYRINLPIELRNFAELGDRVLLIGQGNYLEIWSPESWSKQEALLGDTEANAARFSMLTVSTQ